MMQKKPFKILRILAVVAGVLAVLFFILTIVRETMTGVFEPLFVLFLVCVYHCGVRLIMDTSLSDEDAADFRKVRVVHILNVVLGLLSFVLLLFPHNRVLAAVLIAAVTLLFSVNDLVVLRRLGAETAYDYDYANSAFDENDEDILNTDASVKAAREEAERERNALREAPAEELPSGRRRRKPIVLRSSDPEADEEWSARAADRRTAGDAALARRAARTGEISASDAMAAMAGFGAALNTETPKPVAPKPAAPEAAVPEAAAPKPAPQPEVTETYAAGPSKMTFAKPASADVPADEVPARKMTRQEKKAAKARAKAEKAAAELKAAKERQARSEAALRRYGNPVEASTFTGLESILRAGDKYYDADTEEEFREDEVHYQDELFSGNHDMFGWRGTQFVDWSDDEDYE